MSAVAGYGAVPLQARHFLLTAAASLWVGFLINVVSLLLQPEGFFDPPAESLWAATSWAQWGIFSIVILEAARRFPITRAKWARMLALHALLAVVTVALYLVNGLLIRRGLGLIPPGADLLSIFTMRFSGALLFFGLPNYAGVTAAAHVFHYLQRAKQESLMATQLEARLAAADLEIVRRQIQPSFVFETLASIETSLETNADRAEEIILRLADFLRLTLRDSARETSSVAEQLDVLQSYLNVRRASGVDCPVDLRPDDRVLGLRLRSFALPGFVTRVAALQPWREGLAVRLRPAQAGLELSFSGAPGAAGTLDAIEGLAGSCFGDGAFVRTELDAGHRDIREIMVRIPAAETAHA